MSVAFDPESRRLAAGTTHLNDGSNPAKINYGTSSPAQSYV
jgi:hypothetical protein